MYFILAGNVKNPPWVIVMSAVLLLFIVMLPFTIITLH